MGKFVVYEYGCDLSMLASLRYYNVHLLMEILLLELKKCQL